MTHETKKITAVVGARPNFMKAAPLLKELGLFPNLFQTSLVHTGQHYDHNLSQLFFDELDLPAPDVHLGAGSGTQAEQTARIMIALEKLWIDQPPDLVIVFGDVNSTLAAALVTSKLGIELAHIEAGLRSFDRSMPEEINRIVTDRLSDFLFVSEPSGMENLKREGTPKDRVFHTGNIMIDSLVSFLEASRRSTILDDLSLSENQYAVMTMHRPSNVDDADHLASLLEVLADISAQIEIVFPCHPRTRKEIQSGRPAKAIEGSKLRLIEPIGYLDFLRLQSQARFVITDSGGIQEETTYLQIPCLTIRENTERPITVDVGTNTLTGTDPVRIRSQINKVLNGDSPRGKIPKLWDGRTASRIVEILKNRLA